MLLVVVVSGFCFKVAHSAPQNICRGLFWTDDGFWSCQCRAGQSQKAAGHADGNAHEVSLAHDSPERFGREAIDGYEIIFRYPLGLISDWGF